MVSENNWYRLNPITPTSLEDLFAIVVSVAMPPEARNIGEYNNKNNMMNILSIMFVKNEGTARHPF